ncbi:hypothetical protein H2248_012637 [Termitomyces sp. 'cryptogamus']|nr:hypothetical protein H2248_012590 [Termitomyces sp. 'cryptogamus']KAH0578117.1 hypothetical protein H2248_012591 [Termitomyces sp. 'cryptogamus']KAH0584253.1 hypothetical protein H2248_012635 [Termitomyces sp. 'cryptogamus']KAH0584255.1 hypothetical protein H2248_012636 [Termitomyces sp. 'cryptogamus']KAH0584256.1 hypothetical protein H2248_012637 [Termitomyces sp. 'cryptogamus']
MDKSVPSRLVDGGVYVIVFIGPETDLHHWGLYYHYNLDWVSGKDSKREGRYVPRGHKYHIRSMGSIDGKFIPEHAPTSGVLSSMYLIGLILIGIVPIQYQSPLDSEIRSLDNLVGITPNINCQTWVLDIIERLRRAGYVHTDYSRQQIQHEINQFGDKHLSDAYNAVQPRPIVQSALFSFPHELAANELQG